VKAFVRAATGQVLGRGVTAADGGGIAIAVGSSLASRSLAYVTSRLTFLLPRVALISTLHCGQVIAPADLYTYGVASLGSHKYRRLDGIYTVGLRNTLRRRPAPTV